MKEPEIGQVWERNDSHSGDATLIVLGKGNTGEWHLQGFLKHKDYFVIGKKRIFSVADFGQCKFVGYIPTSA